MTSRATDSGACGANRLFLGIEMPTHVQARLAPLQTELAGVRWQWLADLHLTLRFLGHVPPEQQCRIRDAMRRLDCMPLDLQMQGVGSFSGEVLWAAIAPSERLTQLKLLIDKRLAEAGMPPEGKDFVPHVTLARMHKTPRSVEASFLAQQRTFELAPWTVRCLSLFDSQRNRQGPVYRVLERYALGRGQE